MMKQTKKEFQKVIGLIRADVRAETATKTEYPKPMMTAAQIEKGEATVNCGGEWSTAENTLSKAKLVMQDSRFVSFIERHNAKAWIELNNFKTYQIRVCFR